MLGRSCSPGLAQSSTSSSPREVRLTGRRGAGKAGHLPEREERQEHREGVGDGEGCLQQPEPEQGADAAEEHGGADGGPQVVHQPGPRQRGHNGCHDGGQAEGNVDLLLPLLKQHVARLRTPAQCPPVSSPRNQAPNPAGHPSLCAFPFAMGCTPTAHRTGTVAAHARRARALQAARCSALRSVAAA